MARKPSPHLLIPLLATLALAIPAAQNTLPQAGVHQSEPLCAPVAECLQQLDSGEDCEVIPIGRENILGPVSALGFNLTMIRTSVWTYHDGTNIALIVTSGSRFAFVDFPDTAASNTRDGSMTRLTDAAEIVMGDTVPTRLDFVYSHSHYDHIGGGTRFYAYMRERFPDVDITISATQRTREMVRRSASNRAPEPDNVIGPEGGEIDLGDGVVMQLMVVYAHTDGDLVVYLPSMEGPSILMAVDFVNPGMAPFEDLGLTEDVGRYVEAHDVLLAIDFDILVPGHGFLGDRESIRVNQMYVNDLLEAAARGMQMADQQALQEAGLGRVSDPNAREFGNAFFAVIDVIRATQAERCFRIILEEWGCTLFALDITGRSHCLVAINYLIVDA